MSPRFRMIALALGPVFAIALTLAFSVLAIAQSIQPVDNTITALPTYKVLEPYLISVVGIIVSTVLGWIGLILKQKFNLDVNTQLNASIQTAATNAAASALATLEGPIGDRKIEITNPLVLKGAQYMQKMIPEKLSQAGFTPDKVASIVQAKLGAIQAGQGPTTTVAPTTGT